MESKQIEILDKKLIDQKITRIACQILEENTGEKEVIFIGIKENGVKLARKLKAIIEQRKDFNIQMYEMSISKKKPHENEISFDRDLENLNGKIIILVDDVANTGKTLAFAIKPFLKYLPKKIQIAVLVDRQHKMFPVKPDFVGFSLSTTVQEHIKVMLEEGSEKAYLS
ncbi:MAG: phosphoribosyltransferase [Chitinophagaceae bacterium]|nr:MAG: phosphoribosyltransferase [Chitinophagaceae bacterium]